jgi:DNA-binding winged helix-turn-helix (wHTH) protein/predicted ATPase
MVSHGPPYLALSFGPYRLDGPDGLLWCHDAVVALEPKAVAVLWHLVSRAGQLVSKAELFATVWPETAVTDGVLAVRIRQLRRALGDEAQRPRYIETVHRRGYRFIAPITAAPAVAGPPDRARRQQVASDPSGVSTQSSALSTVPFVGREAELTHLAQRYREACQGRRQVVFLTGDAGMGKTTLVDAFVGGLSQDEPLWIGRGQCVEQYGAGEAYLPLLEAWYQLCRGPGGEVVLDMLRTYAPSWLLQLPALVSAKEQAAIRPQGQGLTPSRMLRELAEVLEALTSVQPLIVVLEDLHWGDASTVEALTLLARRREAARLLVLGTYRPVELILRDHPLKAAKQELQLHGHCVDVPLAYFTPAEVRAYLVQRLPAQRAPVSVAAAVHRRTEGHPLFLATVVDELARQGSLPDTAEAAIEVPASLQQLIELQLGRLSSETQQVLEVASVAGMEFATASVSAGLHTPLDVIEATCDALARRGQFLEDLGVATWPDGTLSGCYGFRHALYQEVLYRRLGSSRRARCHRAIGLCEESGFGARACERAAELAVHFARGRDYERAVRYAQDAADNVLQRFAYREAVTHLTTGIGLLTELPETPALARQELTMQLALGVVLTALKGYASADVEHAFTRARALGRQVGETAPLFTVVRGLWVCYLLRAELRRARALAEQLLRMAQDRDDRTLLLQAHQAVGDTLMRLGDFPAAHAHLHRGLALDDPPPHYPQVLFYGQDTQVTSLAYLALTLWLLGHPEQAWQRMHEAISRAEGLSHPFTLTFAQLTANRLHQFRRERQRAHVQAETAIALATEHGFAQRLALGTVMQGWSLAMQGPEDQGIAQMRQGMAAWEATGAALNRPYLLSLLAETCATTGQVAEGLCPLEEALAAVRRTGEGWWEAELHRLQGELLLRGSEEHQGVAEGWFRQALEIARHQQARSLELRAAMSLARLWRSQNKRADALQLLAPIYGWFTEGFDTADLREAKALLDELAESNRRRSGSRSKKG